MNPFNSFLQNFLQRFQDQQQNQAQMKVSAWSNEIPYTNPGSSGSLNTFQPPVNPGTSWSMPNFVPDQYPPAPHLTSDPINTKGFFAGGRTI